MYEEWVTLPSVFWESILILNDSSAYMSVEEQSFMNMMFTALFLQIDVFCVL